jgi:hypothetical protein
MTPIFLYIVRISKKQASNSIGDLLILSLRFSYFLSPFVWFGKDSDNTQKAFDRATYDLNAGVRVFLLHDMSIWDNASIE